MRLAVENCQFCELEHQGSSRHFRSVLSDSEFQERIYEDDSFVVVPDVAPCAPGHLLVVARDHVRSLAPQWQHPQMKALIHAVEAVLAPEGLIVFEHGILSDSAKPSCVEHAHAHLIPHKGSALSKLARELGDLRAVNDPSEAALTPGDEYALFRDVDGNWYRALATVIPGQAVRRAIIGAGPHVHWNWLDYIEFARQLQTKERILSGNDVFEAVRAHLAAEPTKNP